MCLSMQLCMFNLELFVISPTVFCESIPLYQKQNDCQSRAQHQSPLAK